MSFEVRLWRTKNGEPLVEVDAGYAHPFYVKEENTEIAVFDPKQIHICGSRSDIEKFKEFISNKNEIQNIEDISFEEVLSDTSDSIEIKVYKDDSEEIV